MKLSNSSELLLSFFKNKRCIPKIIFNDKTIQMFKILFNDICDAEKYLHSLKQSHDTLYIKTAKPIHGINDLPNLKNFRKDVFTKEVQHHIESTMSLILKYSLILFNRQINIHFIIEKNDLYKNNIDKYDHYAHCILLWTYILNKYSSIHCSKEWNVFFYFTSLEKQLPNKNIHLENNILNYNHINTGFTTTCPQISEIVIFRKEEWFKVFVHESFHNFALDFSDMNVIELNNAIISIFPIQSKVNLYESYTEFWAETINVCFCSYFNSTNHFHNTKTRIMERNNINFHQFISNVEILIHFERIYSFFQLNKVLNYMGLTYKNLYSKDKNSQVLRETLYKENTNIFAYYVIKCILMNNYNGFMTWCYTNNDKSKIIQFTKTNQNLYSFYNFIKKNYKTTSFETNVDCMEKYMLKWQKIFYTISSGEKNKKNYQKIYPKIMHKNIYYLLNNMKMCICELE
jgi:hypothetical protein